jgi:hypothetical protein
MLAWRLIIPHADPVHFPQSRPLFAFISLVPPSLDQPSHPLSRRSALHIFQKEEPQWTHLHTPKRFPQTKPFPAQLKENYMVPRSETNPNSCLLRNRSRLGTPRRRQQRRRPTCHGLAIDLRRHGPSIFSILKRRAAALFSTFNSEVSPRSFLEQSCKPCIHTFQSRNGFRIQGASRCRL